jgi:T5SS/PEP-CTERM-associated repeat protein
MTSSRAHIAVQFAVSSLTLWHIATPAGADDSLWDNVNGGVFTLASNWFGGVPGPDDVARFETTNSNLFQRTYTVSFANDPTNQQLVVEDDNVTFNLIGFPSNHTYTLANEFVAVALGTVPARSGNLTVRNGTLALPSQSDIEIAPTANASGVLTVGGGGGIAGAPNILVGLNGTGTFEVKDAGSVIANLVQIGVNSGETVTCTAIVSGNGSSLFPTFLSVGVHGKGVLNVNNGGHIESPDGHIGLGDFIGGDPGTGTVNIEGDGSTWDVGQLALGGTTASGFAGGFGTLNITGGGQVATSGAAFIGLGGPGSTGQVNVASIVPGAISNFDIGGSLGIASMPLGPSGFDTGGIGTLLIQAGGIVNVTGNTVVGSNGLLRLEGGALNTSEVVFLGSVNQFSWTAGTLRVGTFRSSLTVPNGGVMTPVVSEDGTTVTGDYNQQAAGATLAVEIGGPFAFNQYSVLEVDGTTALGGTLELNLTSGFVPTALNSFDILRSDGNITGSFANVANGQRLFTADGLGSFLVNYGPGNPNSNHVILSAFQVGGLPGDYNQNGTVDAADYVVWRNNLGNGTSLPNDDTAGVGPDDFARWRTHFGRRSGAGEHRTAGLGRGHMYQTPPDRSVRLINSCPRDTHQKSTPFPTRAERA